ncbi:hypothetical protein DMC64_39215 [Amycolatopsis sp. WAC 04197]|nr:hypothetical protein DMC64_39215 [Amycolatopsis sp. WAC 04197]
MKASLRDPESLKEAFTDFRAHRATAPMGKDQRTAAHPSAGAPRGAGRADFRVWEQRRRCPRRVWSRNRARRSAAR